MCGLDAARDLRGTTVVVTGASSGIGAAAARGFRALGATVAVVGRSPQKTAAIAAAAGAEPHVADFSRLDDVRRLAGTLADRYPRIDVLANNAGGIFSRQVLTADGHELTFQVNYLAPFLLTMLLLDRLAAAPDARVIGTGSVIYRVARLDLDNLDRTRGRYRAMTAYGAAKLAVLLFTRELAWRARGTSVTASAFHPGMVVSGVVRDTPLGGLAGLVMRTRLNRVFLSTPEEGAAPLLRLAATPDPQSVNGVYFHRFRAEEPRNRQAADPGLAGRLWEYSQQLAGVPASHRLSGGQHGAG